MAQIPYSLMSKTSLAEYGGCSVSFISRVLSRQREMSLKLFINLFGHKLRINDEPLSDWNEVFKLARIEMKISQQALATLAGYPQRGNIWRIESGKTTELSLDKWLELVNILNIKGLPSYDKEYYVVHIGGQPSDTGPRTTTVSGSRDDDIGHRADDAGHRAARTLGSEEVRTIEDTSNLPSGVVITDRC